MHNSRIKRISLAICFALLPLTSGAAGLGKLTVISGLGEPLNAEVELLSTSREELSTLAAQLASADVYASQGLERASSLASVSVAVSERPDGMPVLKITSSQPMNDPFVEMLLEVEWSSGKLLREYTALLDPPGYGDDKSGASPTSKAEAPTTSATMPSTGGVGERKSVPIAIKSSKPKAEEKNEEGYLVRKGDTLRGIAVSNAVEGVSLEQMLVGLYNANKEAFVSGNMNRLKAGQILHVPEQSALSSVAQDEAVKEVHLHSSDWNAYKNRVAESVKNANTIDDSATSGSASGKITAAPVEDKSSKPAVASRDVVKLSTGQPGGDAADGKGKLIALQDELKAREKSVDESNKRVSALEKQLQDMQKLMEVKNKSLADAQSSAKPEEPAKPAVKPAEPVAKPEVHQDVHNEKPVAEPPKPVPSPEATPPAAKKPKKIIRPVAPPPEPSLIDGLLENPLVPAGGGLLAVMGGVWWYLRGKRKKGLDTFEQGIITTGGLKPSTVIGNTAGGTVDTGSSSITDFPSNPMGMIDTNDVDPIAEADVYMAYGRDAQAEEILKDAISKDPKRYELHQKLLEILSERKDVAGFETVAGELYAAAGSSHPVWAKVAEMGRKLEPANPLYGDVGAAQPVIAQQDFTATMVQPASDLDLGSPTSGEDATLDFSLDDQTVGTSAPSDDNGLDFDLGDTAIPAAGVGVAGLVAEAVAEKSAESDAGEETLLMPPLETAAPNPEAESDNALDFDLGLPEAVAENTVQLDASELGLVTDENVEFPSLENSLSNALPELEIASDVVSPVSNELEEADLDIVFDEPAPLPDEVASLPSDNVEEINLDETVSLDSKASLSEGVVASKDTAADVLGDGLDFDFDIDLGDSEIKETASAKASTDVLPDLDLSGLSLAVEDEPLSKDSASSATEEIELSASESPDVDTKLDLVTAYIDMGDHEGARELLEEVMEEGGPTQREKAQKLLSSLS